MILPIVWSVAVAAGLDTVHPDWMDISFRRLTIKHLGAGEGGAYM